DRVVVGARRPPGLEVGVEDLDPGKEGEPLARHRRERRAELDARDAEAAARKRERRLPGAAPDLDDARAHLQPGEFDEIVEERVRIRRTRAVVQIGCGTGKATLPL